MSDSLDQERWEKKEPLEEEKKKSAEGKESSPESMNSGEEECRQSDREEDFGLGRPKLIPQKILPPEKEVKKMQDSPPQEKVSEKNDEFLTTAQGIKIPGMIHNFNLLLLVAMLLSIVGILMLSQILSALQTISTLPILAQYISYSAFALMGAVVVFALLRFTWIYLRLPVNRQIALAGLHPIQNRNELRSVVLGRMEESRRQLKKYLEKYEASKEGLLLLGFEPEEADLLMKKKSRLLSLSEDMDTDTHTWVEEFRADFQGLLDKCASRKVFSYAKIVAIKTGINPNSFIDLAIVLYYSFQMVSDLCRIYNLRLGTMGTYYLLGKIFLHAYIASGLEETFEDLSEALISDLKSRPILKHFLGKSAEALANGMILRRLGRVTMRQLSPVAR